MAQTTAAKTALLSKLEVLRPLRRRNFALLMAGRSTSEMGRTMRVFARGWLVLELTGSPLRLGIVTSAISWSFIFMPFFAGVLADRMDRRKLLLYTEFALAILWMGVCLIITLGLIEWWHLVISSLLSGIIQSFGRTGHQAILGNVVEKEELPSAVAINSAVQHWPAAIGLLMATILIGTIGVEGVFWITAFGQLITSATLLVLRWEERKGEAARESMRSNFVEGFRHIRGEPVIMGMVLMAAVTSLFAGPVTFLMPFFARDILGKGAEGLGVLMLFNTLGVSIGALMVLSASKISRRGILLMVAALIYTLLILSFSRSEVFYLSVGLVFGMGLFTTVSGIFMTMIMQMLAPDHLRGRVMSFQISVMGFRWFGVLGMGIIGEFLGAANTALIAGGTYGLVLLGIFAMMPQLRRLR